MDEYKSLKKYLNKDTIINHKSYFYNFLSRILIVTILVLVILCISKTNDNFKKNITKNIFENNISFSFINKYYEKYFGNIIPIEKVIPTTKMVFDEKLVYDNLEEYKEGIKLTVGSNYLMPVLESGIIVYKGEKDNYGTTVIVQQVDGINLWYVGVNSNIKLYDYIEKGSYLGESTSNEVSLFYEKNGEFLDYKEYFK